VLFIMSDDHAAHAVSCYGSKVNSTPNLDRLAKEGTRFENAFVTNSICTPTRAVLLTWEVFASERCARFQSLRWLAADRLEAHAIGGLPYRDDWQVAPGDRSDWLRPLDRPCRARGFIKIRNFSRRACG
jgi:hypothetical protein